MSNGKRTSIKVFLILFFINIVFILPLLKIGSEVIISPQEAKKPLNPIAPGDVIEQSFISTTDQLNAIGLFMGTYQRVNDGQLSVELFLDNESFHKETVDLHTLSDNSFMTVSFNRIRNVLGKKISVKVSSITSSPGNEVTIWSTNNSAYPGSELYINGMKVNDSLIIQASRDSYLFEKINHGISKIGGTKSVLVYSLTYSLYFLANFLFYFLLRVRLAFR